MRERQRRQAEAEGRPYVERVQELLAFDYRRNANWADVMRVHRARRGAESRRAETAAE